MFERKVYEYMRVKIATAHIVEELNDLGQDGWQVVDGRFFPPVPAKRATGRSERRPAEPAMMGYLLMREADPDA